MCAAVTTQTSAGPRILVVRLSAMGDVLHAMPAVATLKHSFPNSWLAWAVEPKWAPLLEGNPFVDEVILIERRKPGGIMEAWRSLWNARFDWVVDFQGLVKSALVASLARPERIYGFHQSQVRERLAALVYSNKVRVRSEHIVERNLELAAATGASAIVRSFSLPEGTPEGDLPEGDFVLASPLAGWVSKQWPLAYYEALAQRLWDDFRMPLVLNGPPGSAELLSQVVGVRWHYSGLPGLIHATRRTIAVVGIDSGPAHLAAALGKPGVAIFGPTDPARNGPYGNTFTVLRSPRSVTTYQRHGEISESMAEIRPDVVFEALRARLRPQSRPAGSTA